MQLQAPSLLLVSLFEGLSCNNFQFTAFAVCRYSAALTNSDEKLPKDTPIMPGFLRQSGSALAVSQATNCDTLLLSFQ